MTEEFKTTSKQGETPVDGQMAQSAELSPQDAQIAARRKMLKAGLIAGPMLMTLRGRPARAQLPSLGSAEIFYGAYVTDDQDPNFGKALNEDGKVLEDKTRRSSKTIN